jgi:hypothetical protein
MAIRVDRETQCMTWAVSFLDGECIETTVHPATRVSLHGRRVPFLERAESLAVGAHRFFGLQRVLGWDVALTPDGPKLLEVNSLPGVIGWELLERRPFSSHVKFSEIWSFVWRASTNE